MDAVVYQTIQEAYDSMTPAQRLAFIVRDVSNRVKDLRDMDRESGVPESSQVSYIREVVTPHADNIIRYDFRPEDQPA